MSYEHLKPALERIQMLTGFLANQGWTTLHHVVSGFGMLNGGELSVIALNGYQYGYPTFVLIDLGAIGLAFAQAGGDQFRHAVDLVGQGVQMARAARPLMGVKWEEGWEKPLDRWREELGIKPVASGANSWYESVPAVEK